LAQRLSTIPTSAKITSTGSDATGAAIYAQAARTKKRVTLNWQLLNIVFGDANLDKAAAG
jgi:aldehyde dehydrogenase (NAD+)